MTDVDLLTLIRGNADLKALADAGNDAGLAAAIPALATVTVPAPFTAAQLLGSVSSANRAKVMGSPAVTGIQNSIAQQDRTAAANWTQLCVDASLIDQTEQAAIMAILTATETVPDTSVTAEQVSRVLTAIRSTNESGATIAAPINWS